MFPLRPSIVRFVKLGDRGKWEKLSVIDRQILCFGYDSADPAQHRQILAGNWDAVRNGWDNGIRRPTELTRIVNALDAYYSDEGDTLWVTFYGGDLYWCFLEPGEPEPLMEDAAGKYSYRRVRGAWSREDRNGKVLNRRTLPGSINAASRNPSATHVLSASARLLQRINGEIPDAVARAIAHREALVESVKELIGELIWQDFEVLADLIAHNSGWRRNNQRGGIEKTIDLDLEMAITGERAFAQVKAVSSQAELDRYVELSAERGVDRMFYMHNSPVELNSDNPAVFVIGRDKLADLVVRLGLVDWLTEKAS
mgnify:CR=1 FL=1